MDEHLVTEILLCLPPKSVYRFRVVSKTWNNLISDPFFIKRYDSNRRRPNEGGGLLAFFQNTFIKMSIYYSKHERDKESLNILSLVGKSRIKCPSPELGPFVNSSDGLILCRSSSCTHDEYHVVNPVTGRFVTLPLPPAVENGYTLASSAGLMCEENKTELAAKFIVIQTESYPDREAWEIRTYSSETGAWAAEPKTIGRSIDLSGTPFVTNGVFHWCREKLALYRPLEEHLQIIHTPADCVNNSTFSVTRTSIDAGDVLWLGHMDIMETMRVFMLPKSCEDRCGNDNQPRPSVVACQEWVVMYDISLSRIGFNSAMPREGRIFLDAFVPVDNNKKKKNKKTSPFDLILAANTGDVFLFHLDTKSIQLLKYEQYPWASNMNFLRLYPYLEPSSLSTYAL